MRFTFFLLTGLAVFYAANAFFSTSRYLKPFLGLIASTSAAALDMLGYEAHANGLEVTAPAFAYRVVGECDGLEPVGFLVAAAFATPAAMKTRCLFALGGALFLFALNIVRLVSLAMAEAHIPRFTDALHWNVWPVLLIVAVLLLWVSWVRRCRWTDRIVGPTG